MRLYMDVGRSRFVSLPGYSGAASLLGLKVRDTLSLEIDFNTSDGVPATLFAWQTLHDAWLADYAAWQISHAVWEVTHAAWQVLQDAYLAAHAAWTAGDHADYLAEHAAWVAAKADYDADVTAYVAAHAAHDLWAVDHDAWITDVYNDWYYGARLWVAQQQSVTLYVDGAGCIADGDLHIRLEYGSASAIDLYIPLDTVTHAAQASIAPDIVGALNANGTISALYTATHVASSTPFGMPFVPAKVVLTRNVATTHDANLKLLCYGNDGPQAGHADSPVGIYAATSFSSAGGSPGPTAAPVYPGDAEPSVPAVPTNPGAAPTVASAEPVAPGGEPAEPVAPVEPVDLTEISEMVFIIKSSELEDAITFAKCDTWDRVAVGRYRGRLSLKTVPLANAIRGYKSLPAVAEFTWSENGEDWESSDTLAVRIANDVYKGDEAQPTES